MPGLLIFQSTWLATSAQCMDWALLYLHASTVICWIMVADFAEMRELSCKMSGAGACTHVHCNSRLASFRSYTL